jgi:hypothetical protein
MTSAARMRHTSAAFRTAETPRSEDSNPRGDPIVPAMPKRIAAAKGIA